MEEICNSCIGENVDCLDCGKKRSARYCRLCKDELPPSRYFNHQECVSDESDSGDLIYFEDPFL